MFDSIFEGHSARARSYRRWPLAAAILLLAVSIMIHRINHDESQYVAAIQLMRNGWPYLDFAYLQTPLQPLLFAPLTLVHSGWLLIAVRVVNGFLAFATILIVRLALKERASEPSCLVAIGALICSDAFLLAGSLARNDALPMALLAGAMAALLTAIEGERRPPLFALAGLLFGLAASAKINAAIPAAGATFFVIYRARQNGLRSVLAFIAGGVVGLMPCIVLAAIAPSQFRFDVFTYSLEAPKQWFTSLGQVSRFSWRQIPSLIGLASRGIVLVGLIAAAVDRRRRDDLLLLDLMIVGGVVAAYLTQPPYAQYLVPLLPSVAVRFAVALDVFEGSARRVVLGLTLLSCVIGLLSTVHYVFRLRTHGIELAQAVDLGPRVALLSHGKSLATLSGELVAGGDINLDRRFAAGPFLFRTSDQLAAQALTYAYSPNWQHVDAELDARPPGAILVGGELLPQPPLHPGGLDAPLITWATTRGYKPIPLGHGFTFFAHP